MTVRKPLPSIETLQQLFELNAVEGILTWRHRSQEFAKRAGWSNNVLAVWNSKYAGKAVGHITKQGYVLLAIGRENYFAHRVIWKMVHGVEPDHIDHIDGCMANNKISNLRNVSALENQRNRKLNANSSSGVPGVHWCKKKQLWISRIGVRGRMKVLGSFVGRDEAVMARAAAEREFGYHNNHGRKVTN